ncbi:MAG: 30S ribosomal protein S18 [Acinetobacter sp.]|jgi:small subunit ribosomal protein S18|uniref:30S ribosomal protein S18 n=1 Tax=Acinetobacter sp. TaxID=472 RepID=UPI000FB5D332|nr:30S ribosomal protein S18 [Acinetobacter sp.]RUP40659.1 MAG: 30S ribosomal protein S18 [Acinetobacter sp.]
MANFYNKKVCRFCAEKVQEIDYKDVKLLQRFLNSYGKIESRKRTGSCQKHQRALAVSLKRARHIAILPFVVK